MSENSYSTLRRNLYFMKNFKIILILFILAGALTINSKTNALACMYGEGTRYVAIGPVVNHQQKVKVYRGCKSKDGIVGMSKYTYVGWTYRYVKY
jgi:hypothetical protein